MGPIGESHGSVRGPTSFYFVSRKHEKDMKMVEGVGGHGEGSRGKTDPDRGAHWPFKKGVRMSGKVRISIGAHQQGT